MEEDDILYQSIIADPEQVPSDIDISGLRTETETSPELLAAVSEFPGLQFDPTQYSSYEDLYDLYSRGLHLMETGTAGDIAGETAIPTPVVETGVQDQVTGDLTPDTTFQDAGATDVPGTIGTLGSLTEPTTQIAPTVNLLDEFGTAGDVYADVPPTTVDTPALDLSGTSTDLISQGVIETPQEFANRAYGLDYEALDQEEQNIINEDYTTKYSLPTYIPSKGLEINVPNTIANIIGKYATGVPLIGTAVDYFTGDKDSPVSERIDFNTYADPSIDAEENQPTPLETATGIIQDPMTGDAQIAERIAAEERDALMDEVALTGESPAYDELDDIESQATALEEDSGISPTTYETPAPTYSYEGSDEQDRDQETAARELAAAQEAANRDAARGGGGDSGGGGGKIVCTMMNETYGFGSFRNKIWLRQSKDLAPEYQKGYHKIFLPLVKLSKTNKIIRKILEHIAVHRTIDIRQESRGKTHILGRVYRKVLEPICYLVGKYGKR